MNLGNSELPFKLCSYLSVTDFKTGSVAALKIQSFIIDSETRQKILQEFNKV